MKLILPAPVARLLGNDIPEADGLGRSQAQVFRCGSAYLKADEAGRLRRAALMQEYLHQKGFAGEMLCYHTENGRDFLVTEAAGGICACSPEWLKKPGTLAGRMGEAARMLHDTPAADCPLPDANNHAIAAWEKEKGVSFPEDTSILQKDTLIHGDYCLPNIFLSETGASFIDLGEGGLGDAHFDLYWAMWSLQYNLGTDQYNERFLDAYGRDRIDGERLRLVTRISGY